MKYFKIIISIIFIVLILGGLVYKNIIAPEDKTSSFAQISDFIFPAFMLFSFFLLFLKKREENKNKSKLSKEDRDLYKSVGKGDAEF